jgi:hypothetical protein
MSRASRNPSTYTDELEVRNSEPSEIFDATPNVRPGDIKYIVQASTQGDRKLMGLKFALRTCFSSMGKTVTSTALLSDDWNLLTRIKELLNPVKAEKKIVPRMPEHLVQFHLRCIAGRVLTLVDALVSDPDQKKAFKTFVKKEFREEFVRVQDKFREWQRGGNSESGPPEELAVADAEFGR